MLQKFTETEIDLCIITLYNLMHEKEDCLVNDEEYDMPFLQDILYLNLAVKMLKELKGDDDFVYSVRTPPEPPIFMAKTNDPEVIEKLNKLFIKIGGWGNVKFLLENIRLIEKE